MNGCFTLMAVLAIVPQGCSLMPYTHLGASNALSGVYSNTDTVFEFRGGRFLQYDSSGKNLLHETTYSVKRGKVYILPTREQAQMTTRRIAVVFTVSGNELVFSHGEDIDTGDVFYKDMEPRIILTKKQ